MSRAVMSRSRVAVIGGGIGGLAVALRLAAKGHRVTVYEQADAVGGKLGAHERGGFRWDTGPSILTLPRQLRDLFAATGVPLDEVLPLRRLDPTAHYRFADGTAFDLPSGIGPSTDAVRDAFGDRAADQWRTFHDRAARLWEATRGPFVESPLGGPVSLLRLAVARPRDIARVAPWRTLHDVAVRSFDDPRLRMLIDRYATYSGSDPRRAPAALAVVPHIETAHGTWYVDGGLRRIADAMVAQADRLGVELRCGVAVERVVLRGGRAAGVVLAGRRIDDADLVVSDVDAAVLYSHLAPQPRQVRRLRRATPSLSGFVLLLGLRGRTPGLRHHTVSFPAQYDAEFDGVFGRGRLARAAPVADPTLYFSVPDDPATAPDGDESWFVLVNAPRHSTGDDPATVDWCARRTADGYADRLLEVMATRGYDVRDRIAVREQRSPADLEAATGSPGGAIYGTSSNGPAAAFIRPANRSPVPGLFLVGGSSHPGGGLPLVLQSAAIVADLVGRP